MAANMQVVTLARGDGTTFEYKRVSARIPEFLKEFPPSDGYRIEITCQDYLSARPGLQALYLAALEKGMKPTDLGLPEIKSHSLLIFEAKLFRNNELICNRHAMRQIVGYKDLEIAETAAFQRLMAAMGFGGELFDDDEDADIQGQPDFEVEKTAQSYNVTDFVSRPVKADRSNPGSHTPPSKPSQPAKANDEPSRKDTEAAKPQDNDVVEEKSETESTSTPEKEADAGSSPVPAPLMNQIRHLAKVRKVAIKEPTTSAEARELLKELARPQTAS